MTGRELCWRATVLLIKMRVPALISSRIASPTKTKDAFFAVSLLLWLMLRDFSPRRVVSSRRIDSSHFHTWRWSDNDERTDGPAAATCAASHAHIHIFHLLFRTRAVRVVCFNQLRRWQPSIARFIAAADQQTPHIRGNGERLINKSVQPTTVSALWIHCRFTVCKLPVANKVNYDIGCMEFLDIEITFVLIPLISRQITDHEKCSRIIPI